MHRCEIVMKENKASAAETAKLRRELSVQKRAKARAESRVIEQKNVINKGITLQRHFAEAQQRFVL